MSGGATRAKTVSPVAEGGVQRGQLDASRTPAAMQAGASLQALAGNHAVSRLLGHGAALPDSIRAEMERRFGTTFDDVRVHMDPMAHAVASAMNAKALTYGSDVVFGQGRFAPGSSEGRHLLAHELAHVVQQRRGGRIPVPGGGSFEAGLESAADHAADSMAGTAGPVVVAGASGQGVALAPEKNAARDSEPDRTELIGSQAWRAWLELFSNMQWDDALQRYTATVGETLHAWDARTYDERRANVAAYFANRVGDVRSGTATLKEAYAAIQETNDKWYYKPLFKWLEYEYGVAFPADAFDDEIVSARAYAYQAEEALKNEKAYLSAFEHLNAARVSLETATILLENYRDDLLQASESSRLTVVGGWGDAIAFLLGAIKGALTQLTDLADSAFWASNEMKTSAGGYAGLAVSTPQAVPVAIAHDVLKGMGAVDPQGRVSTTAVAIKGMDYLSAETNTALGSALSDRFYFTPGELGELAGALGLQVGTAAVGVREIQFVMDAGAALSSARVMVNTYRDNPNWLSDTRFWSGFIGLFLGVVGLKNWSGQKKCIDWVLQSGVIASAGPVLVQLNQDVYDEALEPAERDRRIKDDLKQLAQILLLPLLQPGHQKQLGEAPDTGPAPAPSALESGAATAAPQSAQADATSMIGTPARPGVTEPLEAPAPLGDLEGPDTSPLPDNILPYRSNEQPPRANPEGELVPLRPQEESASDTDVAAQQEHDTASVPLDLESEAALPMAVGYGPTGVGSSRPVLIHDADAIVASSGDGNKRTPPPRPSSVPQPGPTPGQPRSTGREPSSSTGASGPRSPRTPPPVEPAPGESAPSVTTAQRDFEIEVLEEGKRLYLGEESRGAPRGEERIDLEGAEESAADQQARRDRLEPGPAPTEPLKVQLEVDLDKGKRDLAAKQEARRTQIGEIVGERSDPAEGTPQVKATAGKDFEVFEPGNTLYLAEGAEPVVGSETPIGLQHPEESADVQQARRDRRAPGPEPTGPLDYQMQPDRAKGQRKLPWPERFAEIAAEAQRRRRRAEDEAYRRASEAEVEWPEPLTQEGAPLDRPPPAQRIDPGAPEPEAQQRAGEAHVELPEEPSQQGARQEGPPAEQEIDPGALEQEAMQGWPEVELSDPRGEWLHPGRGERTDLRALELEQAAASEWLEVTSHEWPGEWTDMSPNERVDLAAPRGRERIEDAERPVETERPGIDPDDEPTVRMERDQQPTIDPDDEPTVRVDQLTEEPTEEITQPTAPIPADVEVELTDPGSAPLDPKTPQGPHSPREKSEPSSKTPGDETSAPRHSNLVPPDEQERLRRLKKDRNKR